MNHEPESSAHESHARVPFTNFFLASGAELAAVLGLFAWVAPAIFRDEFHRPWMIVLGTALFGIPLSLFEYLYHRYLLHSAVLPFMSSMHRAHSTHHGLTNVKAAVSPNEPLKLVPVMNEFPVEEEHQEESMMFPLWSLPIFYAVFMVLMGIPLKMMLPSAPVISSLIFSVTLNYAAYEVWHAVLHLPYDRFWKPMMEGKYTKRLFKRLYGFHLMHHWRPTANLAIVGLWGVAVWDYAFLTHRRPERLPVKGAEVNYFDAKLKKPLWPIALFDRWQRGLYKGSRAVERFLARHFLRRTL